MAAIAKTRRQVILDRTLVQFKNLKAIQRKLEVGAVGDDDEKKMNYNTHLKT